MTRIAFISDIHANLEALNAVLQEIDTHGADMIICLGDVVGYGPNPKECIDIIRSREIPTIKGNHDDYCSMLFEADMETYLSISRKGLPGSNLTTLYMISDERIRIRKPSQNPGRDFL